MICLMQKSGTEGEPTPTNSQPLSPILLRSASAPGTCEYCHQGLRGDRLKEIGHEIRDSGGRSGNLLRNRFSPGTNASIRFAAEGSDAHGIHAKHRAICRVATARRRSADAPDRSSHTHWRSLSPVYRGYGDADPHSGG